MKWWFFMEVKALQWLRRAADQGHERARNNLGVVLAKGA